MSHSFVLCRIHYVFSTRHRQRDITSNIAERLYPYIGGIAKQNRIIPICIGGVEDHVHALVDLPSTVSIAKGVQLLKAGSSKWIHETDPTLHDFAWQEGYGAFSVSASMTDKVVQYIRNQKEHHRELTFQDEFQSFLKRHEQDFDADRLWD